MDEWTKDGTNERVGGFIESNYTSEDDVVLYYMCAVEIRWLPRGSHSV